MTATEKLREVLGPLLISIEEPKPRRIVIRAEPAKVRAILGELLRNFKEGFYVSSITVVDYIDANEFEVNYNIWMYDLRTLATIKFRLPRGNPTIDTISDLIPGTATHEQEAYDLMGVAFAENPKLRRGFLVAEDLVDGFPLRKDWVMPKVE